MLELEAEAEVAMAAQERKRQTEHLSKTRSCSVPEGLIDKNGPIVPPSF